MTQAGRQGGRGLWEGQTPPITALPDKNQGGDVVIVPGAPPAIAFRAVGSGDYSWLCTVDIGIAEEKFAEDAENPRNGSIVALLEWGHGAASFRAEVDVRRGTQVSFVATSVKCSLFIDTEDGPPVNDGTLQSAVVHAACIWGTRPARSYATRTIFHTVPADDEGEPGASLILIPEFAETLSVASADEEIMDGTTGPVVFCFLGGPLATDLQLLAFDNTADFLRQALIGNGVRFPEGARALLIENSVPSPVPLSLIWGLTL